MLASLDGVLRNMLATLALKPQHDLLGGFGLFVEDRLGLTTVTRLLPIITPLSLGSKTILSLLVLRHLVQGVLSALFTLAICLLCLRDVHLKFT